MMKHKPWLQTVQREIESSLKVDLAELVKTIVETELLTKTTEDVLDADRALMFYLNQEKLAQKKRQFFDAIKTLDSKLQKINELPREKSEKFTKKMSLWLNLSLLPLVNAGVLFPIVAMIKEYLPAFISTNPSYVELKQEHIKKFQTYFYVHLALMWAGIIAAFLVEPAIQVALFAAAFLYLVSTTVIYLKRRQLKNLED
jgi:hypothetical protein